MLTNIQITNRAEQIKPGGTWLFVLTLFFFDSFLFPQNTSAIIILSPLWLALLYQDKKIRYLPEALLILGSYLIIHLYKGADLSSYISSEWGFISLVLFSIVCFYTLQKGTINIDFLFRDILILNFFLAILSIVLLYVPQLKQFVWYTATYSTDVRSFPRLKLFTSSPSLYSAWMAPVAIYFFSRIFFFETKNTVLTCIMICVPLLLSLSLGTFAAITVSGIAIVRIFYKDMLFSKKRKYISLFMFIAIPLITALLVFFYPGNPLFVRIHDVIKGDDMSGKAKTFGALMNAHQLIANSSLLWGIGPGQLNLKDVPNAAAQTIACFGYVGLVIRILAELLLFIKTRVYTNPLRLWLFLFVFLYQFIGSSLTNTIEYIIWALAFSPIFPDFISRIRNTRIA